MSGVGNQEVREGSRAPGFFGTIWRVSTQAGQTFEQPLESRSSWPSLAFAAATVTLGMAIGMPLWGALGGAPFGAALAFGAANAALFGLTTPVGIAIEVPIVHLVVWLAGSRKPMRETFNCIGLSRAPLVLRAIPILGDIAGGVWALGLEVVALKKAHQRSWGVAIAATMLPFVVSIGAALTLRTMVLEAFKIPSGAMAPTLLVQDHVFVTKVGPGPQRGEVIVFPYPSDPSQDFIKRVVGLPGEQVEVLPDGTLAINGWVVPRCHVGEMAFGGKRTDVFVEFLGDQSYLVMFEAGEYGGLHGPHQGPYPVATGEFFVLGDWRDNSSDSRAWNHGQGGGVPIRSVVGRAWTIWLAFDARGAISQGRIGQRVHDPVLPPGAPAALREALGKCLAARPAETEPAR